MQNYRIQICYKDTEGQLSLVTQSFEAQTPEQAILVAKTTFFHDYSFVKPEDMIMSTPKLVAPDKPRTNTQTTVVQSANRIINIDSVPPGFNFGQLFPD
jgi:hypothetical protein